MKADYQHMTALDYLAFRKQQPIRFGCSLRLPQEGRFLFREEFQADPQGFLKRWLEGAISTIYAGPKTNPADDHDGHLLVVPKVVLKYLPNRP